MYEQYTDKQIVEMLKPKLKKLGVEHIERYPAIYEVIATIYKSGYVRGQLGRSFIIGEKKIKEPVNPFKVGNKVKFLGISIEDIEILDSGRFYPPVNTVGEVVKLDFGYCFVQWPDGTTSNDGIWGCRNKYLEKVTERWVPVTEDNVKIGSKVRMIDEEKHNSDPSCYPPVGTIGIVRTVCIKDRDCDVRWPKNTTAEPNMWWANFECLEVLLCE